MWSMLLPESQQSVMRSPVKGVNMILVYIRPEVYIIQENRKRKSSSRFKN